MTMTELLNTYYQWHKEHKFVCATLLYPKKKNRVVYGYIMDIDPENGRILFYDDDAKKVVSSSFYEIDDIRLAEHSRLPAAVKTATTA
mgnify:CR=1 FL=1